MLHYFILHAQYHILIAVVACDDKCKNSIEISKYNILSHLICEELKPI